MGQSTFDWIFVMEDGRTVVVKATFDYVMEAYREAEQAQEREEPVAIIRADFA